MATATELRQAIDYYKNAGDDDAVKHLETELAKISKAPRDAAPQEGMGWDAAIAEGFSNILPSGRQFVLDMVQPFISPVDTAEGIANLASGLYNKLTPGEQPSEKAVDAMVQFFKDRYGSIDAFKNTIANDPVGFISDIAGVFSGGSGLALKAPGTLGKVARASNKIARAVDPAQAVGNVIAKGVAPIAGAMSGTGGDAIKEAYRVGRAGGDDAAAFKSHMRGNASLTDLVDTARDNFRTMKEAASNDYVQGMEGAKAATQPLDFGRVEQSYKDTLKSMRSPAGLPKVGGKELKKIGKIGKEIKRRSNNPKLHTAIELDALKQRVNSIYPRAVGKDKQLKRAVKETADTIRELIIEEVPEYAQTMERYETAMKLLEDIEQTLSLGAKSKDTSIRKLLSSLRNNVNANFGQRLTLLQELEKRGGKPLMPALTGETLNTWTPRGLQAAMASNNVLAQGAGYVSPLLPMMSPRIMGEAAYHAGKMHKYLPPGLLGPVGYQAGRMQNIQDEKGIK